MACPRGPLAFPGAPVALLPRMTDEPVSAPGCEPTSTVDRIRAELTAAGLRVGFGAEPSELTVEAASRFGGWTSWVWVREAEGQVVVHGVAPWRVPEEARAAVTTYVTRANFGMLIGNFEFDLDDGELRYKTSLDFEGCELQPGLVRNLVTSNVKTMDRYLPGLASVIDGADPRAAVEAVESAEGTFAEP